MSDLNEGAIVCVRYQHIQIANYLRMSIDVCLLCPHTIDSDNISRQINKFQYRSSCLRWKQAIRTRLCLSLSLSNFCPTQIASVCAHRNVIRRELSLVRRTGPNIPVECHKCRSLRWRASSSAVVVVETKERISRFWIVGEVCSHCSYTAIGTKFIIFHFFFLNKRIHHFACINVRRWETSKQYKIDSTTKRQKKEKHIQTKDTLLITTNCN